MNKNKKFVKPFFANFLEKQLSEADTVNGGDGSPTNPLTDFPGPSPTSPKADQPSSPLNDGHQTMKYPSDSDEGL